MLFGAMNFPVRPLLSEIDEIGNLGFDYLELSMDPPRAHYHTILEQKAEIIGALDRNGLKLVCHLPTFVNPADITPALREASVKEILESLSAASELQPLKVVVHPSYFMGLSLFVLEEARNYALQGLEASVARADELGLLLCLENLFPQINGLMNQLPVPVAEQILIEYFNELYV